MNRKKVWLQKDNNMMRGAAMEIEYPEIGICGLSCVLCPNYNTNTKSRCLGCKSEDRMAVGCRRNVPNINQKIIILPGILEKFSGDRRSIQQDNLMIIKNVYLTISFPEAENLM